MIFFKKKNKYNLDSLNGISGIQIPAYQPIKGIESPINNIEYILQRKATEHMKNGRMDLAIACLRKSNELMPYSNYKYEEKDYIRLIKYLRIDGQDKLADAEEEALYKSHPEFLDKRISNLRKIKKALEKQKECNEDLILVVTNKSCNICKQYNHKIYSLSGKNVKYKKIPTEIISNGGFCPNCIVSVSTYFEGINH